MIEEMSGDFFQQLRGFYYVAQLGSMGQAAKILHRSQSSVSRLIKQLEQSLDITLFSRVQKGVILTEEGKELFKQAVDIFEKIRILHSGLEYISREPAGHVSMMGSQISLLHFITPLLGDLHRQFPKISLNVFESASTPYLLKQLEDHSLDFAIGVNEAMHSSLDFYPLFNTNALLAVPHDFDVGEPGPDGSIDLKKLAEKPVVTLPDVLGFTRYLEHHLASHGIFFENTSQVPTMLTQLNMIAAGMGMGIVHDIAVQAFATHLDIKTHRLAHIFPTEQYGLLYLKGAYVTPQARAVMGTLMRNSKVSGAPPVPTEFER